MNFTLDARTAAGKVAAGIEESATAAAAALPLPLECLDRLELPGQMRGGRIAAAKLGAKDTAGIGIGLGQAGKQSANAQAEPDRNIPHRPCNESHLPKLRQTSARPRQYHAS
ncbi:hypothetical protein [Aminobacter ciceronei]|uniref:hypothetical protein n=1 Tax=Aminobacter ciceronei TaxID=150723 RepID=UPI003F6EE33D